MTAASANSTGTPGRLVAFARGELFGRVESAAERVLLASPFLSLPVAEHLAEIARRAEASDRRLITALVPGSVRVGVLDPKALLLLMEDGFEVRSIRNLHAKVSIVDGWGLVGSGNLTKAGLGGTARGNVELGVVLNPSQVSDAEARFERWWRQAKRVPAAVAEEFDQLDRIAGDAADGEGFGPALEEPQTEELERILAEDVEVAASRGYWIKGAYHSPTEPDWWTQGWISDVQLPNYAVGDLVFVYLGKRNDGPQRCPAVLRVSSPPRKDREFVLAERDDEAADHWPYVTKTAFVADVLPVERGADLSLIAKTGRSVQRGNCRIDREEFEILGRALCSNREALAT